MAVGGSPLRDAPGLIRAARRTFRTGKSGDDIKTLREASDRTVYLIPACHFSEEIDEVVEDLFEEIFLRELRAWQSDETHWPDTADFALFTRWFTLDGISAVDHIGREGIEEERV